MVLKDTFVDSVELKFQLIVKVPDPAELGARRLNKNDYKGPEDAWKLVPYTLQLVVDAQGENGTVAIVLAEGKYQCGTGAICWDMRQALDRLVDAWVMQFINQTILPKVFIPAPDAQPSAVVQPAVLLKAEEEEPAF